MVVSDFPQHVTERRSREDLEQIILILDKKEKHIRGEKQRFMVELQTLNNFEFLEKLKNSKDSNTSDTTVIGEDKNVK